MVCKRITPISFCLLPVIHIPTMYATARPNATRVFLPTRRDSIRQTPSRSVRIPRSGHGHGTTMTENDGPPKFLDELRQYAMALHTKEQAPGSGKAEAPKERKPFQPTKAGVLRFYEESKVVYDAFEDIVLQVCVWSRSFLCSFVPLFVRSFVCSFLCLFVRSFVCSFVPSFVCQRVLPTLHTVPTPTTRRMIDMRA